MSRLEAALRRAETLNDEPATQPSPADVQGSAERASAWQALPDQSKAKRVEQALAALTSPSPAPAADGMPARLASDSAAAEALITTDKLDFSTVEQYRKLAATLHHAQVERDLKVVMVSSAVSGDGKTLTSTNLALTLSESYRRRVLLIDADLRRPSVHHVFRVRNAGGLTECLAAETERRLPLVQATPYLNLLLAGRPDSDPMSGLTSNRMRRLVGEAAATFDWVIIDTPPIVLMPDANLLAAMADAAILVIGAGKTPYKLITRAIDTLGRGKIIGVLLNRVDRRHVAGGYTYGYYGER
jgi:capsular exopolysaccharide synthesis family protein